MCLRCFRCFHYHFHYCRRWSFLHLCYHLSCFFSFCCDASFAHLLYCFLRPVVSFLFYFYAYFRCFLVYFFFFSFWCAAVSSVAVFTVFLSSILVIWSFSFVMSVISA